MEPKVIKRTYFTRLEDDVLKSLVSSYGEDWKTIASVMKVKNSRQCRERYLHYLDTRLNLSHWTKEEDALLHSLVEKHGFKWKSFVSFFDNRSEVNIKNHWCTLSHRLQKKKLVKTAGDKPEEPNVPNKEDSSAEKPDPLSIFLGQSLDSFPEWSWTF